MVSLFKEEDGKIKTFEDVRGDPLTKLRAEKHNRREIQNSSFPTIHAPVVALHMISLFHRGFEVRAWSEYQLTYHFEIHRQAVFG